MNDSFGDVFGVFYGITADRDLPDVEALHDGVLEALAELLEYSTTARAPRGRRTPGRGRRQSSRARGGVRTDGYDA